ncbi:uncharacterized protein LOC144785955 [Lissotriton helveticus]
MPFPKWGADDESDDDKSREDLHPEKNVLVLLNDLVAQTHEKASFEVDAVGSSDYICRLTFGDAVYIGAGSSKRAARQSAARAALKARRPYHAVPDAPSTKEVLTPDGQNPVSVLNDLAAKRRLPMPDYLVVKEQNVGCGTVYVMGCHVGSRMEKGSGVSKRTAKQEAALKMLDKLKEEEPVTDHSAKAISTARGGAEGIGVRVSKNPSSTRRFPENRRGGSPHSFKTSPGKHERYRRPYLPKTRQIRELRQDLSAPEMHREYDVQGASNTETSRPPVGNQRCPSTQEFNGGPIDHSQYPVIQVPLAYVQNPLAQVIQNTVPIRPPMELLPDRSAPEMHPVLGHHAPHQWTPGPLNTATVRPLMENNQSAQEVGGKARFSFTPASLSSGMVKVLLASQQDLGAQGLNSTEGCDEDYIWARVSKITGMAALFLELKADLKSEKMNTGPEKNAGLKGTFVTLKPAGTLELPLEELEGPSSPEQNAAPGTNASCTLSSPNLFPPGPHLNDRPNIPDQGFTIPQGNNAEYPLTFGKNAGATWAQTSLSHPGMFQTTLTNRQDPNAQELDSAPGKYVGHGVRWPFSFSGMPGHF